MPWSAALGENCVRKQNLLLAFSVLVSISANHPARADTLEEAILRAYENNPSLAAARSLTSAADEARTQAQAAYGPSLGVTASHDFTYSEAHLPNFVQTNDGFGTSAGLTLSQPLFASGRLAAGLDIATANQLATRANLRSSSLQLILDVITAYVIHRRDLELYQVSTEIYQLLLQQRDVVVARYRLFDATEPDVNQTVNRLQLSAGRVLEARASVEVSAARYRNLVGEYPEALEPPPPLPPLPEIETIYLQAELNNPEVSAARFAELASRAEVAAARADMGPQVAANVAARRSPLTPFENATWSESVVAGVQLSMPLYTGGLLSSRVRQALQLNQADQQVVEQTRRDVRESIAANWSVLEATASALPRYVAAVAAAEAAVEGVQRQETSGIRTLRDVLEVTNDLLNARTGAVQTAAELYIRQAAVLRDAGALTVDLFAPRGEYDPDSYAPGGAAGAGLPLRPVVDAIDRAVLIDRVQPAPIDQETDTRFHGAAALENPLEPMEQAP